MSSTTEIESQLKLLTSVQDLSKEEVEFQILHLQMQQLNLKVKETQEKLKAARSNLTFPCGCGSTHLIGDCVGINAHYYVSPRGCNDGDYWNFSEFQILCPDQELLNRVYFERSTEQHLEDKFLLDYRPAFKRVDNDYDKLKYKGCLNRHFRNNLQKYGIDIPDHKAKAKV